MDARIEHAVEDRPDQQRGHAVRGAHAGHQEHGEQAGRPNTVWRMPAAAAGLSCVHPHALQGVAAPAVRQPSDAAGLCDHLRRRCARDAQMAGSEAPKITTTGRPKAAAMWAGPESLPIKSDARGEQGFDFAERRAGYACGIRGRRRRSSAAAPMKTGSSPSVARCSRRGEEAGGGPGLLRRRAATADGLPRMGSGRRERLAAD